MPSGSRRRRRQPRLWARVSPSGVFFSDLGVVNLPSGQPTLQMTGGAAARLAAITPAGMVASVALTMTDEYPYAFAQVIISAIPERDGEAAMRQVRAILALVGAAACSPVASTIRIPGRMVPCCNYYGYP